MITTQWPGAPLWPQWKKIAFRFFFILTLLLTEPWAWIDYIPGSEAVLKYYSDFVNWCVEAANKHLFHQYSQLVQPNGSGDTSWAWVHLELVLLLSTIGCLIWSLLDARRRQYNQAAYWMRIILRYFLIIYCFGYGIVKLFCLQMPFPNMSQLATPLGDYLPMRLSWMFMGYSSHYQFFSGLMEVLAGLLLFYRRTATAGALLAAGVFTNVMMMNISYDIPVKMFSSELLLCCLLLLSFEYRRIVRFFLLNKTSDEGHSYAVHFSRRWMRIARVVLKLALFVAVVVLGFKNNWDYYQQTHAVKKTTPVREGMYAVDVFVRNGDTLAPLMSDTLRWKDVIFERGGAGSVNSADTLFRQRYHRGYFSYDVDSAAASIVFGKNSVTGAYDSLFALHYQLPDSNTLILKGSIRSDSVYMILKRMDRHFQLTERQFHWLSEYNR